ncbi:MAG: STAS domain-containing protein [Planctomycetaceae bacterium]|nr:STAS domain-containing protein [Planctomycetaceae bacterium]
MAANHPTFQFENSAGYSVVTLHPSLNDAQWASIEGIGTEIIGRLSGTPNPGLIVDLSSLNYMGSAMVALVVRLWKAVNERNGRMAVVNKHDMVLEVLRLAGLANVWTIVPDTDAAVAAIGGPNYRPGRGKRGLVASTIALVAGLAALVLACLPLAGVKLNPAEVFRLSSLGAVALGLILGTLGAALGAGFVRAMGIIAIVVSLAAGGISAAKGTSAHAPKSPPESSTSKEDRSKAATPPAPDQENKVSAPPADAGK